MEVVIIVALVAAIAALYAARVGLPGRPRRIDVGGRQRAFLEEFLPVTEAEARRRGMSDEEERPGRCSYVSNYHWPPRVRSWSRTAR